MSFWETNRGLVLGAVVALITALVVHFFVAGQSRRAAAAMEKGTAEVQRKIDELTPAAGMAAPEALQAVLAERAALEKVLGTDKTPGRVGGLLLVLPKDYLVPKNADNPRFTIFERKLAESRDRCNASGVFPRYDQSRPESCPLGFTPEVQKQEPPLMLQGLTGERDKEEAKVQLLLERLYAANRLSQALIEAASQGTLRVKGCSQGGVRLLSSPGVGRMHLRLVPMTVRVATDHKAFVAFLERISREGSFLALQDLAVEVTDPKARTFNFTAEVLALVPREGAGPRKSGDQSGTRGPGQTGVTTPIGRY